jgi:hypothetical protein
MGRNKLNLTLSTENPYGQTEQTQAVSEQRLKILITTLILLKLKSNFLFKKYTNNKNSPQGLFNVSQ